MPLARTLAQDALATLGVRLKRHRPVRRAAGLSYGPVEPIATYSPWLDDSEFQRFMQRIAGNTLVDGLRCHELWQLVPQAARLPGDILEVGVWRGGTAAILCHRAPHKQVWLADTFQGVVKAGARDADYSGGEHADTSLGIVEQLLHDLELTNARPLVGIFPDDFPETADAWCLIHIDVDVYDSAAGVLEAAWPRLSVGGMVIFDDYGFETTSGIAMLVDEMRDRRDRLVIHNLNGHAVVVKLA